MTAASLAHLPLQVGGAALSSAGQAALWLIERYMRAPLNNTAIAALVVTTAMAGSNALYGQQHEHPSPLFAPVEEVTTGSIGPALVIPKTRPKVFASKQKPIPTQQLAAVPVEAPAAEPVGNKDVFALQRKLSSLNLFAGEMDGYYGPKTAGAIRRFEEQNGLKPTGQLTQETLQRILAAPVTPDPVPVVEAPVAVEQPVQINLPKVEAQPIEAELPAAEPTRQSLAEITQAKPLAAIASNVRTVLGRPVPRSPEAALEMAADTAGEAIETIIDGVQSMAMTAPPTRPAAKQPTAAATARLTTAATTRQATPLAPATQKMVAALPDSPRVGVPLDIEEPAPAPGEAIAVLDTNATPEQIEPVSVRDPVVVAKIQRGLASLGFLHGPADGVAGEATAKAIRNFEVYFNYKVTGRITPELLDLLIENGAVI